MTAIDRLKTAIDDNDADGVRSLIREDSSLLHANINDGYGFTLSYAAQRGKVDIVGLLIELGADVHEDSEAPLARASLSDANLPVVELLVQHGAEVNARWRGTYPVLHFACESLAADAVKWLLVHGADPNQRGGDVNGTPLDLVIATYWQSIKRRDCLDALIDAGAEHEGGPPLDIVRGRLDLLERALDENPELLQRPFDFRASYGKVHGGHWGGAPLQGVTMLHVCAEFNEVDAAELLLARGADINGRAKPNASGIGNQTAIYHAVTSNDNFCFPMVQFLLDRGADLGVTANVRVPEHDQPLMAVTPLDYALQYPNYYDKKPHPEVVDLLRQHGAVES